LSDQDGVAIPWCALDIVPATVGSEVRACKSVVCKFIASKNGIADIGVGQVTDPSKPNRDLARHDEEASRESKECKDGVSEQGSR